MDLLTLFEKFQLTLKYHNKLNPKIWNGDKLKPDLVTKLLSTSKQFLKFSGVDQSRVKDVVFTGSNANFNFTKHSDIDCHIVCDVSGLDDNKLYKKKTEWTVKHPELKYEEYPLEFYVHDEKQHLPSDQGIYSLKTDSWLTKPVHLNNVKDIIDNPKLLAKAEKLETHIKQLLKLPNDTKTHDMIMDLKMKFFKDRTAGLAKQGEFSEGNILYKSMRNKGLIDKLNRKVRSIEV